MAEVELLNPVSLVSMGITAVMAVVSYILAQYFGKKTTNIDKWVIFWLIWDAMIHFAVVSLCCC